MDAHRFDAITRRIAQRMTRRNAVAVGGVGLGAALIGHQAAARQATPIAEATPVGTDEIDNLFVQSFASGALEESTTSAGDYALTLESGSGQTIYFSDRPDRIVGSIADEAFLDGRAFDAADPPNAASVAQTPNGEDILVVELLDPAYDAASGTVSYTARPLDGQPESAALASHAARQADGALDGSFGPVSLFIDQLSCGPDGAACSSNSDCCSGFCCEDIEVCPPGACIS